MKKILLLICFGFVFQGAYAANAVNDKPDASDDSARMADVVKALSRLTLGGYGEAAYTRNFYSDQWQRYTNAEMYKDAKSH